jgi:hypothetical protein
MSRTHTFTDWANQAIPYRVRAAKPNEVQEPGSWLLCEINPHGDAWQVFGRAKTAAEAVSQAVAKWNEYDRATG